MASRPNLYLRGVFWPLLLRLYFVGWLGFYMISTPVGATFLFKTLKLPCANPPDFAPEFIAVFASGFVNTGDRRTDYLTEEVMVKMRTAADLLAKFPQAKMILLTGQPGPEREVSHQGELMLGYCALLQIPPERVVLDPLSNRMRLFARSITQLEAVPLGAKMGVVAYDWEFRRVGHQFRRAFPSVALYPAPDPEIATTGIRWLLPREAYLVVSGAFLREWVRIGWGRIL